MAITEHQQTPRILVAGCGKLGGAIASQLTGTAQVYGLRRSPDKVPEGIQALGADLRLGMAPFLPWEFVLDHRNVLTLDLLQVELQEVDLDSCIG